MTEFMIPPSKMKKFIPTIEKMLPIPQPKHTRLGYSAVSAPKDFIIKYPFKDMELWDSFFVPGNVRNTMRVCCFKSTRDRGHRYLMRQWREPDGTEGMRCWRIF
jgi:hypothetical protein